MLLGSCDRVFINVVYNLIFFQLVYLLKRKAADMLSMLSLLDTSLKSIAGDNPLVLLAGYVI